MKKIFVLMAFVLFVAGPFRAQKSGNHNFEINYEPEKCKTFELDASENPKLIRKK